MRPVGFKYRSNLPCPIWRSAWDWTLVLAGFTSLTFGVAVGNVLQGVPFHFDLTLRAFYTGSFFALFNPFALVCGLVSLFMIMAHGALYLSVKTENPIRDRAIKSAQSFRLFCVNFIFECRCLGGPVLKRLCSDLSRQYDRAFKSTE